MRGHASPQARYGVHHFLIQPVCHLDLAGREKVRVPIGDVDALMPRKSCSCQKRFAFERCVPIPGLRAGVQIPVWLMPWTYRPRQSPFPTSFKAVPRRNAFPKCWIPGEMLSNRYQSFSRNPSVPYGARASGFSGLIPTRWFRWAWASGRRGRGSRRGLRR